MSRNSSRYLVVVLLVLVALCGIIATGSAAFLVWIRGSSSVSATSEHPLTITPTHLVLENPVGSVYIQTVEHGPYTIRVRKTVKGRWMTNRDQMRRVLNEMTVTVEENDGEVRVNVRWPSSASRLRSASVDLTLFLPRNVDVDITQEVGRVRVKGITGALHIQVETGNVALNDVTLTGDSVVSAETGSIQFAGRLPDRGTVKFTTEVGSIRVNVPGDSAFLLNASVEVGHIRLTLPTGSRSSLGTLQLSVGQHPMLTLLLSVEVGNIDLRAEGDGA